MKIAETHFEQDGKLVIRETHDWNPNLQAVKDAKEIGGGKFGESRLVGRIDVKLLELWAKEAGVKFGSPEMKEIVKRKMLDPDWAGLRVWEGTY